MDQSVLDRAFFEARLKVNRASRHIHEAKTVFESYLKSDFCAIVEEADVKTKDQIFKVVAQPIPASLVLAIGDAFHCMSSALDYIASGLMRAKTGNATRITFPTDKSRKALRKSFMRPKPGKSTPSNRRIVEAFPLIALKLLTAVQPYEGGDYALWEIRKADNLDKHNLIIPSVTITELSGMCLIDEVRNNRMTGVSAAVGAGGTLNMMRYCGDSKLKIIDKGQPTASIIFPEDADVFAGYPVFLTRPQAVQLVAKAIDLIEPVSRRYLAQN